MKPPKMTLTLISLLTLLSTPLAQAQSPQPRPQPPRREQTRPPVQFTPPSLPSRGRPTGRRRGGASRGSCNLATGLPSLTALIPASTANPSPTEQTTNSTLETVFSLTASPSPSFWFYVPYTPSETPLKFVLQDENNNTLYQQDLSPTSSKGGIIQVTLPATAPALEENTSYRWFFIAYCDEANPAFVNGWTTRVPLSESLTTALSTATSREKAILYAQNSLWQETLTLLGEHHRENTTDPNATRDWQILLESSDLADIATQPLISCCQLNPTR